jgi:hypothetical protein
MLKKAGVYISEIFKKICDWETVPESQKTREQVLGLIETEIAAGRERKMFPYSKILIRLEPPTKQIAREFEAGFIETSSLEKDIFTLLRQNDVRFPEDFQISVELDTVYSHKTKTGKAFPLFKMILSEPVDDLEPAIPQLTLTVLKGKAMQPIYRLEKERLLIGCLPEVQDKEGRLVRKNNIVFPHEENGINATVSTMHARIWFDRQMRNFRIMDESSRYGTRLIREGNTIEVPAESVHGVGLLNGDEVYFGQVCLRFNLAPNPE